MATAAQVAEFRRANQDLTLLAQSQLRDFLSSFRLDGDPTRVRNELVQFFPTLVTTYGDVSALLATDFYDMLRDVPPSAASFRAAFAAPVDPGKAVGAARWAVGALFDEDPDLFTSRISGAAQRLVTQRGRDTIFDNAGRDPVRTSVARVPSGADTCRFCIMLASRGPVYTDLVAAGEMNDFHDNCDCVPTVIRKRSDFPEGYDPERFTDLYTSGNGTGRYAPAD